MDRYEDSFPGTADDSRRPEYGAGWEVPEDRLRSERHERREGREHRRHGVDPEGDLRQRAVHRIRARRNLTWGLLVYLMVNGMLVYVWARNGGGFFWPLFPIAFWGIGLLWQVMDLFSRGTSEDRIQAEMRRLGGADR